jgi:hypothetical protein
VRDCRNGGGIDLPDGATAVGPADGRAPDGRAADGWYAALGQPRHHAAHDPQASQSDRRAAALAVRAVFTPQQLAKVAQLKDRMDKLQAEMRGLFEGNE